MYREGERDKACWRLYVCMELGPVAYEDEKKLVFHGWLLIRTNEALKGEFDEIEDICQSGIRQDNGQNNQSENILSVCQARRNA